VAPIEKIAAAAGSIVTAGASARESTSTAILHK